MRFSELTAGYEFPAAPFDLDPAAVADYLAATDDDNALYWRDGAVRLVPPLAVAALAFRDIACQVALEPGSLHTGQELTFHRPVQAGERLTTRARVAADSRRRGFTALIVELAADDAGGTPALSGRMTVMVAGAEGQSPSGAGGATPPPVQAPAAAAVQPLAYTTLLPTSEIVAGRDLGSITRTLTQQRIDRYAAASGDFNPIHVDPAFGARSPFGRTVAHGMLLLAYVSCLLTRSFGRAWTDAGRLRVKFRNPAPAGATVTAQGQIERVENDDHGVQYAMCAVRLCNAADESLLTGEARIPV